MTSEIRANTLKNRVGLGTIEYSNTGPVISGVTTSNNFKTGSTNVHSVGIEAAGINVLGADTPIGTGSTIYNSGAAVFTGIVTANNLSVTNDIDVGDDLTIGGEFKMIGSSDSAKYFDARTGASNSLNFRSSLGGASNLVTILSIGRNGSSFNGDLTLGDSSDTSSAAGPEFTLNRNSASPANADYLGQIKFAGRSSTGVQRNYAKITGKILDVTNGSEDGILEFAHIKNGSQNISARFRSDSLQLLNGTNFSVAGTSEFTGNSTFGGNLTIPKFIYHSGDTDTYFDFGTNTINLAAGGNIGLTILDSSVRVTDKLGINGAAPQVPLDVMANGSGYAINIRGRSSDNVGELRFTSNNYGSLYSVLQTGATYLNFQVGSTTNALRITSDGKIGINDAAPERTMDVRGSNCMIQLEGTAGNGKQYSLCSTDDATGAGVDGGPSGSFAIYDDSTGQARLRIDPNGNTTFLVTGGTLLSTATGAYGISIHNHNSPSMGHLFIFGDNGLIRFRNSSSVYTAQMGYSESSNTMFFANQEGGTTMYITGDGVKLYDNNKFLCGNDEDLEIYHNNSNAFIKNDTGLIIHRSGGHTFENAAGSTQYFRIYDDGYAILGDTSKSSTAGAGGFDIQGNSTNCILEMGNPFPGVSGGVVPAFRITATNSNKNVDFESIWGGTNQLYKHITFAGGNTMFYNGTSNTEVVRITGSGLVVGTTNYSDAHNTDEGVVLNENGQVMCRRNSTMFTAKSIATGGYTAFRVLSAQTQVGSISFNSGGTSFNTSSDYRRKENVIDLTGAITRLKTLKPKRFNFTSNPSVTLDGFLAHEVTAVPEAVTGTKDEVATEDGDGYAKGDPIYQQLDQSKLVPLLTAALQEAISEIETLKTKVAALEG